MRGESSTETGRAGRRFLRRAVRERLVRLIAGGRWRPGERLPSEPRLAQDLGVSRATLRDALRSLEEDGFVTREHGAGTFVTFRPRLRNNLDVNFGVTRLIEQHGFAPGVASLAIARSGADQEWADRLALAKGDEVVVVERVRTADGAPVVFSREILPVTLFAGRTHLLDELGIGSLYEFLRRELGVVVEHGVASLRPAEASARVAGLLKQPEGALLLLLSQVDFDVEGRPVLLSYDHHLADAFELTVVRRGPGRAAA
jgi:GntR family transcriptional regulator